MREHGVPSFPDAGTPATGSENSIGGFAIPASINLQSPAFKTAWTDCQGLIAARLSPQGRPGITASMKASLIAHAQCMRTHGVPAYPDPSFPSSGGIMVQDTPGVSPQAPAYEHAQAACGGR